LDFSKDQTGPKLFIGTMVTYFILTKYDVTEKLILIPDSWVVIKWGYYFAFNCCSGMVPKGGGHPKPFTLGVTLYFILRI